jgi:putative transcriptional regulator
LKNEVLISLRGSRTQKEIAEALNISIQMYNAVENGKRFPGKDLLKRLSEFYGKSIEEIFFSK